MCFVGKRSFSFKHASHEMLHSTAVPSADAERFFQLCADWSATAPGLGSGSHAPAQSVFSLRCGRLPAPHHPSAFCATSAVRFVVSACLRACIAHRSWVVAPGRLRSSITHPPTPRYSLSAVLCHLPLGGKGDAPCPPGSGAALRGRRTISTCPSMLGKYSPIFHIIPDIPYNP